MSGSTDPELDSGSYVLVLELREEKEISVGRLGSFSFAPGHYLYVGSAMKNLRARIARHHRLEKKLRWHIDYLREAADSVESIPIPSTVRRECEIATVLASKYERGPRGFGSSDCGCDCHLFYSSQRPPPIDHTTLNPDAGP